MTRLSQKKSFYKFFSNSKNNISFTYIYKKNK
jgi:hypothetical protein